MQIRHLVFTTLTCGFLALLIGALGRLEPSPCVLLDESLMARACGNAPGWIGDPNSFLSCDEVNLNPPLQVSYTTCGETRPVPPNLQCVACSDAQSGLVDTISGVNVSNNGVVNCSGKKFVGNCVPDPNNNGWGMCNLPQIPNGNCMHNFNWYPPQ